MPYRHISFMLCALLLGVSMHTLAAEADDYPCKQDVKKFCADAKDKEGVADCMKEHGKELSAACKKKMAKSFLEACGDDMTKYCPDVEPGGGRKFACLREHKSQLSETCKPRFEK